MRGIRAVVSPDHEQQIHRNIQQFTQCILSFLGSAADGIEETKILRRFLRTIAIENCLAHSSLHFLSLPAQHRGLIRYADSFPMHIRIEPGGVCTAELVEELLLVPDV